MEYDLLDLMIIIEYKRGGVHHMGKYANFSF